MPKKRPQAERYVIVHSWGKDAMQHAIKAFKADKRMEVQADARSDGKVTARPLVDAPKKEDTLIKIVIQKLA